MPPVTPERVGEEHGVGLGEEVWALRWPDTYEELGDVGTCGLGAVVVVVVVVVVGAGGEGVLLLVGTCGLEASNENSANPRFRSEDCAPTELFKGFTEFFKRLGVQLELGLENKLGPHGLFALIKLSQTLDRELSTLLPLLSSSSSSEMNML